VIGPAAPYPASETLLEGTAVTRTGATVAGAEFIDPAPWFTPENRKGYDFGDGYHLTTDGHAFLAEKVNESLVSYGI